jgi:hypothetical protein
MDAPEARSKALNEHMSSGFAPRADLLRAGTSASCPRAAVSRRSKLHRYSITSSARASSDGGTSRPRIVAVCRLMMNSNLVGCSTGRSASFSPLRVRSA